MQSVISLSLKLLFFVLLLPSPVFLSCKEGCLKCDIKSNFCLVCDSLNMYYLSGTACNKADISNCYRVGSRGECLQCVTGYYYDTEKKNCFEVPRAYLLQNCVIYSRFNVCSKCNADSYLTSEGSCVSLPTRISHCNEYKKDDPLICIQCFKDYVLSSNGSSCIEVSELDAAEVKENCGSYSRFTCQSCNSPYILSPSSYSEFDPILHDSDFSNFLWYAYFSFSDRQLVFRTCELPKSTNCSEVDSYSLKCSTCDTGYYLNGATKTCLVNPPKKILNCVRYTSVDECMQCQSGNHLAANKKTCEKDELIEGCETFDTTAAGATKCLLCVGGSKLNTGGTACEGITPLLRYS